MYTTYMPRRFSLDRSQIKVLLLGGIHKSAKELLLSEGYSSVELLSKELAAEELLERIADVHLLGIRSATQVQEEILRQAKKLIAIGCYCIGTNQVDLKSSASLGIPVFNSPFANTRSVAELVIGTMLMLMRRVPEKSAAAHRGEWLKSSKGCTEARGKTFGIVGYGHIGTQVGILAEMLGMHVLFYDIERKLPLGNAKNTASLRELLSSADIVTLHVPGGSTTRNMIGAQEIACMRKGSILINAARGTIVDTESLAEALRSGHLAGAAIDVHPKEPTANDQPFVSPLQNLPNVILTPHIGGSTAEAQERIAQDVTEKLLSFSNAGTTEGAVNFPEVHLPTHEGKHRILHMHKNVPGVLAALNEIFAASNANIAGQYLKTDEDIGYVVTDIDEASSPAVRTRLKDIPGTIRTRVLY